MLHVLHVFLESVNLLEEETDICSVLDLQRGAAERVGFAIAESDLLEVSRLDMDTHLVVPY